MKKVLFAAIFASSYSSIGMVDGFKDAGYIPIVIDWQAYRFRNGIIALRIHLIETAKLHNPDLIFLHIQNGEIIDEQTAIELAKYGFVVNFSEDVRTDISWYEKIGQHIGLTVFTNMDDVDALNSKGIRSVFMPTSYNHLWYKPQAKTDKYYGDIVFVGSNYLNTNLEFEEAQERVDMVRVLKEEFGNRFMYYGLNWGPEIKMLNPQEVVECYNNARIVVTQNNFKRKAYQSDRFYNAAGSGALVIPQNINGSEFDRFSWTNFDDLKRRISESLIRDNIDCGEGITQHADIYKYWLKEQIKFNHRWVNRFMFLTEKIEKMYSSVFHKKVTQQSIDNSVIPCRMAHSISGIIPNLNDAETAQVYVGKVCDCGKLRYIKEECGCSIGPGYKIVGVENV